MKAVRQEYNAVDIAKFVCALLVVAIHIAPFGLNNSRICMLLNYAIQEWFARIAVPFFFAASGFFLFRKVDYENFSAVPIKRYVKRLICLYVIWSIIYFPLHIQDILTNEKGIAYGMLIYSRDFVFAGSHTQLWYFPALIFSVIAVSFLIYRKWKIGNIIIVSGVFYALGLLAQSWFGIIEPLRTLSPSLWNILRSIQEIIVTTRGGLFEGMLFVGMGALIAYNGFNVSKQKALLGFFASYLLMLFELAFVTYFHLIKECDMYIFLVPLTYFSFGLAVNWRIPAESAVFKTFRTLSSLIFYTHMWVSWFAEQIFGLFGINIGESCLSFIFTIVGSVLFSYIIFRLSERNSFRWLKKIY